MDLKQSHCIINAHYIDENWELTKQIISFQPLLSPHTGKVIGYCLSQVLIEWKALNKISIIALDNTSSNKLAVTQIKQFITDLSQNASCPETSKYFYIQYSAHILNLVFKDGLKLLSGQVDCPRESVKYIHSYSSLLEAFEHAMVELNINPKIKHPSKDVLTQWNATYL